MESSGENFGAQFSGKLKMVFQSFTILVILVFVNYRQKVPEHIEVKMRMFRDLCIWATVFITVISGLLYVQRAVALYRKREKVAERSSNWPNGSSPWAAQALGRAGTCGSLVTCAILFPILHQAGPVAWRQWTIEFAALVLFCVLCVKLANWGINYFGKKIPVVTSWTKPPASASRCSSSPQHRHIPADNPARRVHRL